MSIETSNILLSCDLYLVFKTNEFDFVNGQVEKKKKNEMSLKIILVKICHLNLY